MTDAELKVIQMNAFANELEKIAGWSTVFKGLAALGKFSKNTFGSKGKLYDYAMQGYKAVKKGGNNFKAFSDFTNQYAAGRFTKTVKNGVTTFDKIDNVPKNSGFIQSHIGDATEWITNLKQGMGKGKGFFGNFNQGLKNFWSEEKNMWRQGGLGTKTPDKLIMHNGQEYVKNFGFKRKVVGRTYDAAGNVTGLNFKKSIVSKGFNGMMSPMGMIGSSMLLGAATGGGMGNSAKEGLKESLFWTPATKLIGMGKMVTDIPGMVSGLVQ